MNLEGKRILVTGGTGSLGRKLVERLLRGEMGTPTRVTVFSRDEAKQHQMRLDYLQQGVATDEVIYRKARDVLDFCIGDVRDYDSVASALRQVEVVFHAAALKQVPTCEYFPYEAVRTNVLGPQNLVRALRENNTPVELIIGISTDKACQPINVMGMTKALQERIFIEANRHCPDVRLMCVRYGNVVASRGSVIPLFLEQIENGGPVTVTTPEMTRFLLSLDRAVDTVFAAVRSGQRGETYISKLPSVRIVDLVRVLIGDRPVEITYTGIRPGEKVHEVLVSEEECFRTVERDGYYVVCSILPELRLKEFKEPALQGEYSSRDDILDPVALKELLRQTGIPVGE